METMMDQASAYYPPPESQGGWRRLEDPDQIRALAGMDVEALAPARAWNRQFDVPSSVIIIRRGYLIAEWHEICARSSRRWTS